MSTFDGGDDEIIKEGALKIASINESRKTLNMCTVIDGDGWHWNCTYCDAWMSTYIMCVWDSLMIDKYASSDDGKYKSFIGDK